MSEEGPPGSEVEDSVGLCRRCVHARIQDGARGSRFWRCARADSEKGYLRYPPLPVRTCPGHRAGTPGSGEC